MVPGPEEAMEEGEAAGARTEKARSGSTSL